MHESTKVFRLDAVKIKIDQKDSSLTFDFEMWRRVEVSFVAVAIVAIGEGSLVEGVADT